MKKELSTAFNARQYMRAKDFEIFYYYDRNLNHVKAHQHAYYEVYFFLEGDVTYEVDGRRYDLQRGDFLLVPPQTPHHPVFHSHEEGSSYRRFVLWFGQDFYESLASLNGDFDYSFDWVRKKRDYRFRTDYLTCQEIQGKLLDLIEETGSSRPFHEVNSYLMAAALLIRLNRIVYDLMNRAPAAYENALYLNVCDYINNHLEEDLSLDRLAAFFYVSKYHISHIFKDNMGISPHQYILKKRLQASKNGILSGIPLNRLCQQYGFSDYTSFYRAFKKEFGLSPKEFRDQKPLPEGYVV